MAGKQAQALAIKLSRERRAGKNIPPPAKGRYSERTRQKAERDLEFGIGRRKRVAGKKKASRSPGKRGSSSAKKR